MNYKILGLVGLVIFAILQISACFVAAGNTTGFVSVFYYILGGVSCLFGIALDFLLFIIAVDVFGSVFGVIASNLIKKQNSEEDDEELDEDQEEVEVIDTPEE